MTALHRRPVRHVLVGLALLLLVGAGVLVLLAVRYQTAAEPLREATARAAATVLRSGLGDDGRGVELRWTDQGGQEQTGIVRASGPGTVRAGARVDVRYVPSDPARVYASGDQTEARVRDIGFGIVLVAMVLAVAVAVTAVHVLRRILAERRPGTATTVRYARSRRRLLRRSWLVLPRDGGDWWVPVHWDPALSSLRPDSEATVHGQPGTGRVVAVDVAGTTIWQSSGRVRSEPPRGELDTEEDVWSPPAGAGRAATASGPVEVGLGRHLRTDGALLVAAPLLGLAWAYIDGTGWAGAVIATVLVAGLLVWLPTLVGSDPT